MKNTFITIMLILGTLSVFSAPSPFTAWFGLELSSMSFLPIIPNNDNNASNESMFKYFLIQALASSFLIMVSVTIYQNNFFNNNNTLDMLLIFPLMLKLGAAPLHLWMFPMVKFFSWYTLFLFLTLQKIAPLLLISIYSSNLLIFFILMSLGIPMIMAINQNSLKMMLTYTSLNHISWLLTATFYDWTMIMSYILIYSILLMACFLVLKSNYYKYISMMFLMNKKIKILTSFIFLSLSGFPPLMIFLPKIMILYQSMNVFPLTLYFLLILSSSILMYMFIMWIFPLFSSPLNSFSLKPHMTNTTLTIYLMMLTFFILSFIFITSLLL